jgi:hypothetical protein
MPQAPQTPSSQQRATDLLDDTLNSIHQGVLEVALIVEVAGDIAGSVDSDWTGLLNRVKSLRRL